MTLSSVLLLSVTLAVVLLVGCDDDREVAQDHFPILAPSVGGQPSRVHDAWCSSVGDKSNNIVICRDGKHEAYVCFVVNTDSNKDTVCLKGVDPYAAPGDEVH